MTTLRKIGKTEILVSPVALGCWPIAGMTSLDVNDVDSERTIRAAIDSGINFLDTAFAYGRKGESERLIARSIVGQRDKVVIASKGGSHWDDTGKHQNDGRPERLKFECEESLKRLRIDTIDLLYLHAPDPKVPVVDSATAYADLIAAGKIRAVGVSNLSLQETIEFHSVCEISAIQPPYNMLQRDIESDLIPWCVENEVSVINYWPLMKGLLAGKIRRGHQFDPTDKRLTYEVFQGDEFEKAQCLLDGLDEIATQCDKTVAQVVTNWTMNRPGITSTLCGAKRDWQIRETAGAMGWELTESHLRKIDSF